jgi:uncharacterized protein YbjT (DUF2867 family)
MILITGATGFIGRHLTARLIAENYPIRCLLPVSKQRVLPWDGSAQHAPEIVTGTIFDEEALFKAVTGVHTIIHLENSLWWGRLRDMERIEVVGTRNLISVARSARVGRMITMSHLGAAPSSAFPLLQIKGVVEDLIRRSGLAYTIIRSGIVYGPQDAFINHIAMTLALNPIFFLMPGQGEVVLNPIFVDDLVEILFRSLETIDVVDETVEVGGPEYVTLADMLATVMRLTGRYRFIIPVPPYSIRWISGIYSRVLPRALMTPQWMDILAANRTAHLGNVYTYFGIHTRRFEDTLLTYLPHKRWLLPAIRYAFRRRPRGL